MAKKRRIILLILVVLIITGAAVFTFHVRAHYLVPIAMYHSIDHGGGESKLIVSPESFARQMEFLSRRGYNVISLEELIEAIREGKRLSGRTVVITFDDGYENNYTEAFPVLRRHGYPATVFIILNRLGEEGYLSWEQCREMSENGISIGSHTLNHPYLTRVPNAELRYEIVESREIIEEGLGGKVAAFCYPYGDYDEKVRASVREAGYRGACITKGDDTVSPDDVYTLRRVRISPSADNLFVFWIKVSGYHQWLKK